MKSDVQYCLCGAQLPPPRRYSANFLVSQCGCGAQRFLPDVEGRVGRFVYDGSDEKYGSVSYLRGAPLRWAHMRIAELFNGREGSGRPRTLEIGCFNGFFVHSLREAGVDAFGTDLNSAAVETGRELWNLGARITDDFEESLTFGPFDAIIMIDCLEHLEDPYSMLEKIKENLSEGGKIIVAGPIKERFFFDKSDYPPHHIWRFSRDTLARAGTRLKMDSTEFDVQYDFALFLRNLVGKAKNGLFKKEYHGEAATIVDSQIPRAILRLTHMAGRMMDPVLRRMNMPYYASIQIYQRTS